MSCIASASYDGTIRIWDVYTWTVRNVLSMEGPVIRVVFHPSLNQLASAGGGKDITIWDLDSSCPILTLKGHSAAVYEVCYSSDGTQLASRSYDKSVIVWDSATGAEIARLVCEGGSCPCTLRYSEDGGKLIVGYRDAHIRVWDTNTWQVSSVLTSHRSAVKDLCVPWISRGGGYVL